MPISFTSDIFTNFAISAIAGGAGGVGTPLNPGDATLHLNPSTGLLFPATGPSRLVIGQGSASPEVATVTARSGDILTLTRAQEGTVAGTWPVNTVVQHDLTAGNMANVWSALQTIATILNGGGAAASNLISGALTFQAAADDWYSNANLEIQGALAAPSVGAFAGAPATGSGLGIGAYKYAVTYASADGETLPSSTITVTTTSGNQHVSLTAIPVSGDSRVTTRNLYRSKVGTTALLFLATIGNNIATTYTDSTADGSLGVTAPTVNTFGGSLFVQDSSGTTRVAISSGNTHLPTKLAVSGTSSLDSGAITTDGAGNYLLNAVSLNSSGQQQWLGKWLDGTGIYASNNGSSALDLTLLAENSITLDTSSQLAAPNTNITFKVRNGSNVVMTAHDGNSGWPILSWNLNYQANPLLTITSQTGANLQQSGGLQIVSGALSAKSISDAAITNLTAGGGGNIPAGTYKYVYTKLSGDGESLPSNVITEVSTGSNGMGFVIPVDVTATGFNVYRTKVNGSTFNYLTLIPTSGTIGAFWDSTPDSSLGSQQPPAHPSYGGALLLKNAAGVLKTALYSDGAVSFDTGAITSDGSGNLTLLGTLSTGQSASAAATASNGTITTAGIGVARVAPTGNITGVILQAGTVPGQQVTVLNESAFTLTFDVSGTSHVADGASDVIAATTARRFVWDSVQSLWYRLA